MKWFLGLHQQAVLAMGTSDQVRGCRSLWKVQVARVGPLSCCILPGSPEKIKWDGCSRFVLGRGLALLPRRLEDTMQCLSVKEKNDSQTLEHCQCRQNTQAKDSLNGFLAYSLPLTWASFLAVLSVGIAVLLTVFLIRREWLQGSSVKFTYMYSILSWGRTK